jgi:hypothetical protein
MLFRLLLTACLLGAGCHWSLDDPGTEPKPYKLYFPTGLAIDPAGRYLYVSNANADLRYGGGTVQVVDTARFEAAVAAFRADPTPCPAGIIDDRCACRFDPLDPSVVDCAETIQPPSGPLVPLFLVPNTTVKVGNFAGEVRVRRTSVDGAADTKRRLFVAVRGDPSVTFIDVDTAGFQGADTRPGALACFTDRASVTNRPGYNAATNVTTGAPGCDADHLIQTYECVGQPSCTATTMQLPPEPFSMTLDEGVRGDGTPYARLVLPHLASGQVTLIDATSDDATHAVQSVSTSFFAADGSGRHGAFALAPRDPGTPGSLWYLTSNLQPTIATFRIADFDVVVPSVTFSVGGAFATGNDVRDVAFEPGGLRAFLTANNPPSVVVLDTAIKQNAAARGQPNNQVVDIIDVCQTPSHMGVRRAIVPGAPGTPGNNGRLRTQIFVVCFLSNQVMIVDPDLPAVSDTIIVGRGPNDIAFNFGDQQSPGAGPRRAYITQFAESTIGVLDLEPGSPTENRLVARIGLPAGQ